MERGSSLKAMAPVGQAWAQARQPTQSMGGS
jgi:hypothetical protein